MTALDLSTTLEQALPSLAYSDRAIKCTVVPEARPEVCQNVREHSADVQMLLACGHVFSYCRRSLYAIYGHTRLTEAVCPLHGDKQVKITAVGRLR